MSQPPMRQRRPRSHFSSAILGVPKRDNALTARSAKIRLRRLVLDAIPNPRVFDVFAGEGEMFDAVWKDADAYCGCDVRYFPGDRRELYCGDNVRVLRSIPDLSRWNIFDLDAYGSPWDQAIIIADRRELALGERLGLCFTEGTSMKMRLGGMPTAFSILAGLRPQHGLQSPAAGVWRFHEELCGRAIADMARRLNGAVVQQWSAKGKTNAKVLYLAAVIERRAPSTTAGRRQRKTAPPAAATANRDEPPLPGDN